MWVRIDVNLNSTLLGLAMVAAAAAYAVTALGGLLAAAWVRRPRRALRVAAWSGGLAAFCVALTAALGLANFPSPDDDLVHILLWSWLVLFLGGVALVVWQGLRAG